MSVRTAIKLLSFLSSTSVFAQEVREGCNGAKLLLNPEDPSLPGPSPVGYRQFEHMGLQTAVWYPAEIGSDAGKTEYVLDIRRYLPPSQIEKITDAKAPWQYNTGFYEDLPLDTERGPYPVIIFVHGTAAWKEQSLPQMRHWASRGFVVLSQDHPGLFLGDILASVPLVCPDRPTGNTNIRRDTDDLLRGLRNLRSTNMTFLQDHVDLNHMGVAGHSAGAGVGSWGDIEGIRTLHLWAGGARIVTDPARETHVVVVGAIDDAVVAWRSTKNSYEAATRPKWLVGMERTGHLFCSNICDLKNAEGDGILKIAQDAGVCGAAFAGFLFDCDHTLPDEDAWEALNYISSATMEESLQCLPIGNKLNGYKERFAGTVEEYEHQGRMANSSASSSGKKTNQTQALAQSL